MLLRFDRGTLVFDDPESPDQLSQLPEIAWDPRIGRHRAPAWCHAAIVRALSGKAVRFSDEVRPAGRKPDSWEPVSLRPYQETALAAWEMTGRRGTIVLPTGSGKTRIALAAMARGRRATLCLVPTRVLLHQWVGELRRFYGGHVAQLGDGMHEVAPLTVSTFESAYRRMAELGNRFDLLIVDEVHHFGTGARDEALEMCTAAERLGLTATPPDGPARHRLDRLVGPVIHELRVGDLAGGALAPFDVLRLRLELTEDERWEYDRCDARFRRVMDHFRAVEPHGTWQRFVQFASGQDAGALHSFRRMRRLVAFPSAKRQAVGALLERHRDARMLLFTSDNETAYGIARAHLVMPLTCDIGRDERAAALASFREGTLRVLVSARVLNEGLDVPDADVGIIVGAALGTREHVQRIGRLLRPREGKRALVVELVMRRTLEENQSRRRSKALASREPAQP
jgi:superfamily II DNA or RNA helicase